MLVYPVIPVLMALKALGLKASLSYRETDRHRRRRMVLDLRGFCVLYPSTHTA